jgi:hypothetical protein
MPIFYMLYAWSIGGLREGLKMSHHSPVRALFFALSLASPAFLIPGALHAQKPPFPVSARCVACHNNLKTAKGQDVSIGSAWKTSIMANSSRDPYWQASVRREALDHASAASSIENECATCHMPLQHLADKAAGHETAVFSRLPLDSAHDADEAAMDGVSCSACHEAAPAGLGDPSSYNGNLTVVPVDQHDRPIFGPYPADPRSIAMHTASAGLTLAQGDHLRQAGLCGSCHTLYTTTLDASGKPAGRFPEQMPYLEWLHSDFHDKQTCEQCHMPAITGPAPDALFNSPSHEGLRLHSFTGANFFMLAVLSSHHDELAVNAKSTELDSAAAETSGFLKSQAAHISLSALSASNGKLSFSVAVQNLTGHKFPTAYPSRRAWLHVTVTDASGHTVFESGRRNDDGSIAGNLNDADPKRYSPHYSVVSAPDQVEIFEPILGDAQDHVTTALLTATHYLKDNRILPAGFDKQTASPDISVRGKASTDPAFLGGGATTHYEIPTGAASGPFAVKAELLYQPVGFRWAHNLEPYKAAEPQRFVAYYEQASRQSAIVIAEAKGTL